MCIRDRSKTFTFAGGVGTQANGIASLAMGLGSKAIGDGSVALGYISNASGNSSVAMGNSTNALGSESFAIAKNTIASEQQSVAMGSNTYAAGYASVAMGEGATAGAFTSFAMLSSPVLSSGFCITLSIKSTIVIISGSFRPLVVIAAAPKRIPEVTKGDLSSKGTMFLFVVISALTKAFSASFTLPIFTRLIDLFTFFF